MAIKTVSIREAARRLSVHENTIRGYMDSGMISSYRLPSGVRKVPLSEVERLEAQAGAAAERPAEPEPVARGSERHRELQVEAIVGSSALDGREVSPALGQLFGLWVKGEITTADLELCKKRLVAGESVDEILKSHVH